MSTMFVRFFRNKNISDISDYLQELAWYYGSHGLEGECCQDLSLVEFMALKTICENNHLSIQEIGNTLNFTKSGATRIINRLENKGYVKRERSEIDGRVCCAPATYKGAEIITKILEEKALELEKALESLEPDLLENIKDVLEVLLKAVR
jgi:DNA-binding MarR family transcriptional regulator